MSKEISNLFNGCQLEKRLATFLTDLGTLTKAEIIRFVYLEADFSKRSQKYQHRMLNNLTKLVSRVRKKLEHAKGKTIVHVRSIDSYMLTTMEGKKRNGIHLGRHSDSNHLGNSADCALVEPSEGVTSASGASN